MSDEQIQQRLLARLAFTLALNLPDDPSKLAVAWPSVLDGALFYDVDSAQSLSPEGSSATEDAAIDGLTQLNLRDGIDVPRVITGHVPTALVGERRLPCPLKFAEA